MTLYSTGYVDQLESFSEWSKKWRSPATYADIQELDASIFRTNSRIDELERQLESNVESFSLFLGILLSVCIVLVILLVICFVILFRQNRKLNCLLSNRYDDEPVYNPHHNDGFSFDPNNNTWTKLD